MRVESAHGTQLCTVGVTTCTCPQYTVDYIDAYHENPLCTGLNQATTFCGLTPQTCVPGSADYYSICTGGSDDYTFTHRSTYANRQCTSIPIAELCAFKTPASEEAFVKTFTTSWLFPGDKVCIRSANFAGAHSCALSDKYATTYSKLCYSATAFNH